MLPFGSLVVLVGAGVIFATASLVAGYDGRPRTTAWLLDAAAFVVGMAVFGGLAAWLLGGVLWHALGIGAVFVGVLVLGPPLRAAQRWFWSADRPTVLRFAIYLAAELWAARRRL